jgi:hypothetical protein
MKEEKSGERPLAASDRRGRMLGEFEREAGKEKWEGGG